MKGLPRAVKDALQKARDSALLAVEIYNKPAVTFKSGGYITLMVIVWTSLFHAIFYRKGVKPYYRKPNRRYERVDGDYKHWELGECGGQGIRSLSTFYARKLLPKPPQVCSRSRDDRKMRHDGPFALILL